MAATSPRVLQRVGSRQRVSMIENEPNPFLAKAGDTSGSTSSTAPTVVKVENLSDAKLITAEELRDLIGVLLVIEDNEGLLRMIEYQKIPYLFTSANLLEVLSVTTSVRTRLAIIASLGPRLTDPKARTHDFLELFRYADEKSKVEEVLKARSQTLQSSLFKQAPTRGSVTSAGRGGGAAGGAGASRSGSLLAGRGGVRTSVTATTSPQLQRREEGGADPSSPSPSPSPSPSSPVPDSQPGGDAGAAAVPDGAEGTPVVDKKQRRPSLVITSRRVTLGTASDIAQAKLAAALHKDEIKSSEAAAAAASAAGGAVASPPQSNVSYAGKRSSLTGAAGAGAGAGAGSSGSGNRKVNFDSKTSSPSVVVPSAGSGTGSGGNAPGKLKIGKDWIKRDREDKDGSSSQLDSGSESSGAPMSRGTSPAIFSAASSSESSSPLRNERLTPSTLAAEEEEAAASDEIKAVISCLGMDAIKADEASRELEIWEMMVVTNKTVENEFAALEVEAARIASASMDAADEANDLVLLTPPPRMRFTSTPGSTVSTEDRGQRSSQATSSSVTSVSTPSVTSRPSSPRSEERIASSGLSTPTSGKSGKVFSFLASNSTTGSAAQQPPPSPSSLRGQIGSSVWPPLPPPSPSSALHRELPSPSMAGQNIVRVAELARAFNAHNVKNFDFESASSSSSVGGQAATSKSSGTGSSDESTAQHAQLSFPNGMDTSRKSAITVSPLYKDAARPSFALGLDPNTFLAMEREEALGVTAAGLPAYSYKELVRRNYVKKYDGLVQTDLEQYLADDEFLVKFGMPKVEFNQLAKWRRIAQKKALLLF